jgi:hypothetical protein
MSKGIKTFISSTAIQLRSQIRSASSVPSASVNNLNMFMQYREMSRISRIQLLSFDDKPSTACVDNPRTTYTTTLLRGSGVLANQCGKSPQIFCHNKIICYGCKKSKHFLSISQ